MPPSRIRAFAVLLSVVGLLVACFTHQAEASEAGSLGAPPTCIPASKCCKICDAGQACGNSCISASKQCHKGRGCSCNAAEVCP